MCFYPSHRKLGIDEKLNTEYDYVLFPCAIVRLHFLKIFSFIWNMCWTKIPASRFKKDNVFVFLQLYIYLWQIQKPKKVIQQQSAHSLMTSGLAVENSILSPSDLTNDIS